MIHAFMPHSECEAKVLCRSKENMRFRLVVLLAWLLFGRVFAQSATDLLVAGGMELRGSVIPFYLGEEPQPSAVVRVERAHGDYQQAGFFKIGVLPIGVLEGVTIQVERPELVAASFARLQQWLDLRGSKRVELRRARIQVAGSVTNSLQAGRILVAADGRWELLDGIRYDSAETHIHAQRATLRVIGNQSGQIVWQTDPPATNHLFNTPELGSGFPGLPSASEH